jgi:hypothetical protein
MTTTYIKCSICLDHCLIPVEIICFGCDSTQFKPSCYSFHRLCQTCAETYLELDKPFYMRSSIKRCLFCNTDANPRILTKRNSYRKDFLTMSQDKRIVRCPNHAICGIELIHIDIERHYERECPHTIIECMCGVWDKRQIIDSAEHKNICSFYKFCDVCKTYCNIKEYEHHLKQEHNLIICVICHKTTSLELNIHLENECIFRLIFCKYCRKYIRSKDLREHYVDHIIESRHNMHILSETMESEQSKILRMTDDCNSI